MSSHHRMYVSRSCSAEAVMIYRQQVLGDLLYMRRPRSALRSRSSRTLRDHSMIFRVWFPMHSLCK